jgi:hypothetical protein
VNTRLNCIVFNLLQFYIAVHFQESSRNRHKQKNGSQGSDKGRKGDEEEKMKASDSESLIIGKEISKRKMECDQLSDSKKSEKEEEKRSVMENRSLSYSEENSGNGEEMTDKSKKKERHQGKSKSRLKLNVEKGKCNSMVAVGTEEQCKAKLEQQAGATNCGTTEDVIDEKLPKELDEKSAKLACGWLEEHGEELAIVGETLALRARRCLEKKVCLKTMTDPENVDKVVRSLQLLMKLAGENLEQIGGFLSLHHKYWIKRVKKHRFTETVADVSISNQQDYEDKTKKSVTEHSKDDGNVSVTGLGGDDFELQSLTENQFDNIEIENREKGTPESDILNEDSLMSMGMRRENSKKRKLLKEGSDSDDREVVSNVGNERNLQKSVIVDKKRRKLEDGLEMGGDRFLDPDVDITLNSTETSGNCKRDSEVAMKRPSEQINTELEDVSEEKMVKAICTYATEDDGNTEDGKVGDKKELNVDSSEKEEVSVAECSMEDLNLLPEAADRVALCGTSSSGDSSALNEVDRSERSFESLSTLPIGDHGCTLPEDVVADILNAQDKSVGHVEEVLQENQSEKSDEQNYEKSRDKSEGNSADVAAIDEGGIAKENENVSDNNNESDVATLELMSDIAYEKSMSDEDYGNGKNEKENSVESLADDLMPNVKRHPEENRKVDREVETDEDKLVNLEVSENVEKDPLVADHADVSTEDIKELEIQNYITKKNENNVEPNKLDTHEYQKKDNENKCGEKMKLKSDDEGKRIDNGKSECEGQEKADEKKVKVNEGDKISDVGELVMNDDIPECEGENDGKVKIEMNENKTIGEDVVEERTVVTFRYTTECIKAQQTLLEYTTDDADDDDDDDDDDDNSCTGTLLKKKKRKTQSGKEKREGVAACRGVTPAKKWLVGPKSRTHRFKETTSSSVSSETDESEYSIGRQLTDVDRGRKKKFKLKDTEAYKQDEKLRWKCTVAVEHMPNEVFQKHYEQYYSDGEEESEKRAKHDNEIDR